MGEPVQGIVTSGRRCKRFQALTPTQGFTILEAIVALMITMITITIALQMYLAAAYLRVRAKQFGEVYNWVQEDYETVKAKAETFEMDSLPYSSACRASPANSLAATFITHRSQGLGGSSVTLGTRDFSGSTYTLTRTANHTTTIDPRRLVALNYELMPTAGGNPEFEIDAEVVIYAAFKCPN